MFGSSKKKKPSLLKRLIYLVVLLSSSGGVGGWALNLQDYPQVKALLGILTDAEADGIDSIDVKSVERKVASAVVGVIKQKAGIDFSRPGVYQVVIPRVTLDPAAFRSGETVNIQAKVIKIDPRGRDATIWESKPFGERVAVVGKDELTTGWPVRTFQVPWSPGDQIVVEVSDHRGGLFAQPRRFALAPADPGARDFPLKSGTFSLVPIRAASAEQASRGGRIEFRSSRVGGLDQNNSTQVAERPIVIK